MSLDHGDDAAVLAFSEEVDRRLGHGESGLETWSVRLVAVWIAAGLLITVAVRTDGALSTALYLISFGLIAVWVAGFYAARGAGAHWYRR